MSAHRRDGKAYVYSPQVQRESTFRRLAGGSLEKVFDGEVDEYLVHAFESRRLSARELDQLETMIANARSRSGSKRKKGGRK